MEIWKTLQIEKTNDKKAIAQAYRAQLKLVNPEDKPEEFKQLRAAYEQALHEADSDKNDDESAPKTPLEIWMARVDAIYTHFAQRILPEAWRELLHDDICDGIDSRLEARNALLRYLMQHYFLPQPIWQMLDRCFSLKESKQELCEIFPAEFIEQAVINGIDYPTVVPYNLFAPNEEFDHDAYIAQYSKTVRALQSGDKEAGGKELQALRDTHIFHPYTLMLNARMAVLENDIPRARTILDDLLAKYPQDDSILSAHGDIARLSEDYTASEADFRALIALQPENLSAKFGLARTLRTAEKPAEAKELLLKLLDEAPNDGGIIAELNLCNEALITLYEKAHALHPEDDKTALELGWCYLQTRNAEACTTIVEGITPTDTLRCDYENLYTKLLLNLNKNEEALTHAQAWEAAILALPENGEEDTQKQREKLGSSVRMQCVALANDKKFEAALACIERALKLAPEDTDIQLSHAHILYSMECYDDAITTCSSVLERHPHNDIAMFVRAQALFQLGLMQEAYNDFGACLAVNPYNLGTYIYRIRILFAYEQWEDARKIVAYLEQNKVESESLRYAQARLMEVDGKVQDAYAIYTDLLVQSENEKSDIGYLQEIYYRIVCIDDGNKPDKALLDMIEKGLACRKNYLPLLNYKAFLLSRAKQFDTCIAVNKTILEYYPNHRIANERIADIYYDQNDFEQAYTYYTRQLSIAETASVHEMAGICARYLEKFEESRGHLEQAIALEPRLVRPYCNLGDTLQAECRTSEAEQYYLKALTVGEETDTLSPRLYRNLSRCYARMGRYEEAVRARESCIAHYNEAADYEELVNLFLQAQENEMALLALKRWSERLVDAGESLEAMRETAGALYLLRGDEAAALQQYRAIDQTHVLGQRTLGNYYFFKGDYRKACAAFKQMLKIEPNCCHRALWASYSFLLCGDKKQAHEWAEKALAKHRKDLDHNMVWQQLIAMTSSSMYLSFLGRYEEAKDLIDRALHLPLCEHCNYGKCKDAYLALGIYHECRGEYSEAAEAYRTGSIYCKDDVDFICGIRRAEKFKEGKTQL